ncbi:MAG: hypothetical protein DBX55_09250 [Verrucomicrobia bacterium]|nr:MAG: hypothetical protein DBX55_09250 [Verrucomicrobiota bacterium]
MYPKDSILPIKNLSAKKYKKRAAISPAAPLRIQIPPDEFADSEDCRAIRKTFLRQFAKKFAKNTRAKKGTLLTGNAPF